MNLGGSIMIFAVGSFVFVLVVCGVYALTYGYEGSEREAINYTLKGLGIIFGIIFTAGVFISVFQSLQRPQGVIRTVEIHYINGETEIRRLQGTSFRKPRIEPGYTPYYNDDSNCIYGVVRFKVIKVDTIPTSK